jgi:indolepyruvate ferredoxin oxidoreductase
MKTLRGGPFDVFGRTAERREERRVLAEYEEAVRSALAGLDEYRLPKLLALANLPEEIRGYGPVREKSMQAFAPRWAAARAACG